MTWTKRTRTTDSWTKKSKSNGFLSGDGFLSYGFLSDDANDWSKKTKPTDTWTKVS